MLLSTVLLASFFHSPFHHRKQTPTLVPHEPLTMDTVIDREANPHLSKIQEYIIAYQAVRDSLPAYRDDYKFAELEVDEIAAVQADLDTLEKIDDPEHDPTIAARSSQLAADAAVLINLDNYLHKVTAI